MKIDIKELADVLGKGLAYSDDQTQAEFLNNFAKELSVCCGTNLNNQICYMSDKLNAFSKQLITELAEYIELRQKDKP